MCKNSLLSDHKSDDVNHCSPKQYIDAITYENNPLYGAADAHLDFTVIHIHTVPYTPSLGRHYGS